MMWVVGQFLDSWHPAGVAWDFKGLYNSETKAVAACMDDRHFIFCSKINHPIPQTTVFPSGLPGFRVPRQDKTGEMKPRHDNRRLDRLFDFSDVDFVHRQDKGNAGDWYSVPQQYFELFRGARVHDLAHMDPMEIGRLSRRVVVGGGGLLGRAKFSRQFLALWEKPVRCAVGWGLGDNLTVDFKTQWVDECRIQYPDDVERFDLLGVRDWGTPYRWVPCASCLHPSFAKVRVPIHDVVVYENKMPTGVEEFPKMQNTSLDMDAILDFLGSGHVVITNSYHGAYWAQLLGRGVLAFPFSSKFWHMRHRVTLCRPGEWKENLSKVEAQPPALEECVAANVEFKNEAMAILAEAA
jgi:hypothetical protein